ncbi:hypothetical protein BaRGS_00021189 [Batillaria attramentaria]|uniref:Uncharacterized protein n=1 Tax=Batillaria attramentaria TaxID=370345 RepID=A0ABD0KKC4_9CAEN
MRSQGRGQDLGAVSHDVFLTRLPPDDVCRSPSQGKQLAACFGSNSLTNQNSLRRLRTRSGKQMAALWLPGRPCRP